MWIESISQLGTTCPERAFRKTSNYVRCRGETNIAALQDRRMTIAEDNPYEAPIVQEVKNTVPLDPHVLRALKSAVLGPVMLFPVLMFYGAIHGFGNLFGYSESSGFQGAARGFVLAFVLIATFFCPLITASASACIGFLGSVRFPKHPFFWFGVVACVGVAEYVFLVMTSWIWS